MDLSPAEIQTLLLIINELGRDLTPPEAAVRDKLRKASTQQG